MLAGLAPADRHRRIAARFGEVVAVVDDWGALTPVQGWTARDVVDHLVEWSGGFLAGGGLDVVVEPSCRGPAERWPRHCGVIQRLLEDPAIATAAFTHPVAGAHTVEDAIDTFYTPDVFMHTWDLARAAGVSDDLDPAFCAQLLEGMQPIEAALRSSGHFGPAFPVDRDADIVAKLMAFIGRDPNWGLSTDTITVIGA